MAIVAAYALIAEAGELLGAAAAIVAAYEVPAVATADELALGEASAPEIQAEISNGFQIVSQAGDKMAQAQTALQEIDTTGMDPSTVADIQRQIINMNSSAVQVAQSTGALANALNAASALLAGAQSTAMAYVNEANYIISASLDYGEEALNELNYFAAAAEQYLEGDGDMSGVYAIYNAIYECEQYLDGLYGQMEAEGQTVATMAGGWWSEAVQDVTAAYNQLAQYVQLLYSGYFAEGWH